MALYTNPSSLLHIHMPLYATHPKSRASGRRRRRMSSYDASTVQYHSLADSLGGLGRPLWKQRAEKRQKAVEVSVLTMNILDSSQLPATVTF